MLAGKHEELPTQQRQLAHVAALAGLNDGIARVELRDLGLDVGGGARRFVHLALERVDVCGVGGQRGADLGLEGVDGEEVGEEGDEIFDFEERGEREEVDCSGGVRSGLVGD